MSTATFTDDLVHALERFDTSDIEELFTEDVELVSIDQTTPPSAPGRLTGRDTLTAFVDDMRARGLTSKVERLLRDGDTIVVRTTCTYPDGKHIAGMALLDLRDGKVARYEEVQAWDA